MGIPNQRIARKRSQDQNCFQWPCPASNNSVFFRVWLQKMKVTRHLRSTLKFVFIFHSLTSFPITADSKLHSLSVLPLQLDLATGTTGTAYTIPTSSDTPQPCPATPLFLSAAPPARSCHTTLSSRAAGWLLLALQFRSRQPTAGQTTLQDSLHWPVSG